MRRSPILTARAGTVAATVLALAAFAAFAGCNDTKELVGVTTPGNNAAFMARYVALGNSLTAGWQSGGINDSTQKESYARLVALAAGTRYAYASLNLPGCPPPVNDFLTQAHVGGPAAPPCALRNPASATMALNNVAVPDATVRDPLGVTTPASNALTTFILGGKPQVQRALEADPTFVSIWIGNNDALVAGISGLLAPVAGVSPGLTPSSVFDPAYTAMLDTLTTRAPGLKGVLIGVVNVTNAPVLFPAATLVTNAQFRAVFEVATGGPGNGTGLTILPNCTATTRSLISVRLASAIRTYRTSPTAAGAHPPVISCEKGQFPASALVGDVYVLDAAEIDAVTAQVNAYNALIQQQATARTFAYFDPNPTLVALKANGSIPVVPNLTSATAPFGTFMSLDGVHPRRPAHVLIANGIIAAINAKYGSTIPNAQ